MPFKKVVERACTLPQWQSLRARIQHSRRKVTPKGSKPTRYPIFNTLCRAADVALTLTGKERWIQRALQLRLEQHDFYFSELPSHFNGYRILHISDIHVDSLPGIERAIMHCLSDHTVDLCVLTGDYRDNPHLPYQQIKPAFEYMTQRLQERSRDGIIAVLGNHDGYQAFPFLTDLNVRVLLNETISIEREDQRLLITGVDDVFYFYTKWAAQAFTSPLNGFKIALVHSPDLNITAADHHYHLYLTGHTHGGQICLPKPIITHGTPHQFASGPWRLKSLQGYTSRGAGVSRLPVRINCPGEIAIHTLYQTEREDQGGGKKQG